MSDTSAAPRTTRTFRSGFVITRNRVRVIAQYDALADLGAPDSVVLEWWAGASRWSRIQHVEWTAVRLWVQPEPGFKSFTLGLLGQIAVEDASGNVVEERIDDTIGGPRGSGDLRDLRGLGGDLVTCGMQRRVYRRAGPATWIPIDDGVARPRGDTQIRGFNSVDGNSIHSAIAVGFAGEIWRREEGAWSALSSPTNLVLHRVRITGADSWVACGQAGVVILGAGETCSALDHNVIESDIWGLEIFQGAVWLATDSALFRLDAGQVPRRVETGLGAEWTYRHLHSADGVLWSFGPRHIAWTEDCTHWHDATP